MLLPLAAKFIAPTREMRKMAVLMAIRNDPDISQHKLGRLAGLSSSMANNYVKELRGQRLISITGQTNRTQRYHLTAAGRQALVEALIDYSAEIIRLYIAAKADLAERLRQMAEADIRTVALYGASGTAEVVYAALKETPLTVVAVFDSDPGKHGQDFNNFTIQPPEALTALAADAVVITSFAKQEEIHRLIHQQIGDRMPICKLSEF